MTNTVQNVFRVVLGASLVLAGIGHLSFARIEFQAQVPDWIPMDKDLVVVLSGFAEILLGLAIIFVKKYRVQVGLFAALFFILVLPGNIHQYVNRIDAFGLDSDNRRLMRLFFQPVLIFWAVWSTGAWAAIRKRKQV